MFKSVYWDSVEKSYENLFINGKLVVKIINSAINDLNNRNKINIHQIFHSIMKELYNSAYSYCVMSYHSDLEVYFND